MVFIFELFSALDAFGKVPAGLLIGNYEWLGDYDECASLQGLHYCHVNFAFNTSLPPPNPVSMLQDVPENKEKNKKQTNKRKETPPKTNKQTTNKQTGYT